MLDLRSEALMIRGTGLLWLGGTLSAAEGAAEVPPKTGQAGTGLEEWRSSARRRGASPHPLFTVETQT